MKRTPILVMVALVLAGAANAQTTVSPSISTAVADPASLVARITELERQLDECRQQAGASPQPVTNIAQPAPAYVPAPRYGGGFRMAPEQRLTCADYSESYFERHPTMAKVCGHVASQPASVTEASAVQDEVEAAVSPAIVTPSTVSTTGISPTQSL